MILTGNGNVYTGGNGNGNAYAGGNGNGSVNYGVNAGNVYGGNGVNMAAGGNVVAGGNGQMSNGSPLYNMEGLGNGQHNIQATGRSTGIPDDQILLHAQNMAQQNMVQNAGQVGGNAVEMRQMGGS
jgi:hypothetical protein